MLVLEKGPGDVFVKLREYTGIEYDAVSGEAVSYPDYNPLHCLYCTSLYTTAAMFVVPSRARRLLAVAGIVYWLEILYLKIVAED